ncbi:hypothetical protein [Roseateles violae]|uniref:DUF1850 domain-containing protein n=1 Tax=Roseateles violae TaxID=3058042 RepID=A0ABT8DZ10_9BURK|nr:hypothetical protein [Pelomonas sp. PFR6]MDN3922831.1 hypothetical protein [Pelomonas sp. PFR6]
MDKEEGRHPVLARAPRRLRWALPLIALLFLPLGWALFGPRGVTVEVEAKRWRFELEVEQYVSELGSDWCEALPADARDVSRRWMDRPDGQRAEHCRYSQMQWRRRWGALKEGGEAEPPAWPEPRLKEGERLGQRKTRYELLLRADDGRLWTCALAPEAWRRVPRQARFRVQVDRQGTADCATLPAY